MKIATVEREVKSSGVMQTSRATIKATAKVFDFFANQTYANKHEAICRELVANGNDGHTAAGKAGVPVEVWLPSSFDPVFRVRDRGIGMSHEFMMTSFMAYTDGSTKDQSDEMIGGFGIGSKSPFSYVDQFTITSIHDGVKSVYTVYKDEENIPAISLLAQTTTDEGNGVEVSFPVQADDHETFEQAAFNSLQYFDPRPIIKNAASGAFKEPEYAAKGKSWAMRKQPGDLGIIMGGIRYPVSTSSIQYKFAHDTAARKLLSYGLDLWLPIGTCQVSLSREALSYDDKTIDAIKVACENVIKEVADSFSTMFDKYDSVWEAQVALWEETGSGGYNYSARGQFLKEHAQYRGKPLSAELRANVTGGWSLWEIVARKNQRTRSVNVTCPNPSWQVNGDIGILRPGMVEHIIIDDLPVEPKSRSVAKVKEFVDQQPRNNMILVMRFHTKPNMDDFGNPPEDMITYTSSLPEPQKKSKNSTTARPKVRMFKYDGTTQYQRDGYSRAVWTSLNPGQYGKKGVEEVAAADQPLTGIKCTMEQFQIPENFRHAVAAGFISYDEVHFINKADADKLDETEWPEYTTVYETRKTAALAKFPDVAERLAVANSEELSTLFSFFQRNTNVGKALTGKALKTPLGQVWQLYNTYYITLDSAQRKLAPFVTPTLPKGVDPAKIMADYASKQWKAALLIELFGSYHRVDDKRLQLLLENI